MMWLMKRLFVVVLVILVEWVIVCEWGVGVVSVCEVVGKVLVSCYRVVFLWCFVYDGGVLCCYLV